MPKNNPQKNISNNWQTKKLGEICDILDNKRKPITKRNRISGKYPYYGATGILDYVRDYIFNEKLILIGEDGAKWESGENTAFIAEGKYWVNNHAHVIRPHRNIVLDNWIIYFFFFTDLTKFTTGLTVPKLNQTNLKQIQIPIPPLPEQTRIVKILDKTFAKIETAKKNAEKNLRNSKELFESYLQSVFAGGGDEWEEKRLGEVCEIVNGGTPDTKVLKYWDGNNLWITPKDMGKLKDVCVSDTTRKISNFGLENSSAKLLPIDSVILSSRAPIGHLVINKKEMATNQGCKGIIPCDKLETLFLYYFLKSSVKLLNNLGSGTTFKELSGSKLAEVIIPFSPLTTQKQIVAKLDALSASTKKLEKNYQQKVDDLEELKKSVLKKAFEGEL